MEIVNLYRYENKDGSVVITPVKRDEKDQPSNYRLIADEGKILVKDDIETECVDIEINDLGNWSEIDKPEPPEQAE